jgi:hypothetical protein
MPKARPTPAYLRVTEQALEEYAAALAESEPPPAPAAPVLSAAEKAERLRQVGPAAYLYGAAAPVLGEAMDVEAWKRYLDSFVEELGVTKASGPVARMMAEQLALCYHAVARLHVRFATRTSAAETAAYSGAITHLQGEFRRTAIALQAYVAGSARRTTVAPRTRARPPSGVRPARRAKKAQRGKVASNGNGVRGHSRGRKHAVG